MPTADSSAVRLVENVFDAIQNTVEVLRGPVAAKASREKGNWAGLVDDSRDDMITDAEFLEGLKRKATGDRASALARFDGPELLRKHLSAELWRKRAKERPADWQRKCGDWGEVKWWNEVGLPSLDKLALRSGAWVEFEESAFTKEREKVREALERLWELGRVNGAEDAAEGEEAKQPGTGGKPRAEWGAEPKSEEAADPTPEVESGGGKLADNPKWVRLTQAAFDYNIPKSSLSRAANDKRPGSRRLTAIRQGGKLYVKREEVRRFQIARERVRKPAERAGE